MMQLTTLERGALYWAVELVKREVDKFEQRLTKSKIKDTAIKKINEEILEKKKAHLKALEDMYERSINKRIG